MNTHGRTSRWVAMLLLVGSVGARAEAQRPEALRPDRAAASPEPTWLRGQVVRTDGRPLRDATVYLLETLEETRADSTGTFALRTAHRGLATIVARAVGFTPTAVDVTLPLDSLLRLSLVPQPPQLTSIRVVAAGEYTIGSGQGTTLTPLEVAQMPGAAANIARAVQTLPGVQGVDEGTGLFVRGGDVTETRILVDEAWMLSPVRFDNPTGHVTSTLNPFLLDRTTFAAGAFGARYGNALSGLVRMETAAAAPRTNAALSASIGSWTASAALAPRGRFSARASLGLNDLAPLMATFGQNQPFEPAPRGGQASATAEWRTSRAGRLRWFGVRQDNRFGVGQADEQAATNTRYAADARETMHVLSWRDSSTAWRPAVTLGWSAFRRDESFGGFRLVTDMQAPQLVASLTRRFVDGTTMLLGGERESWRARYAGTVTGGSTPRPVFDSRTPSVRTAVFAEAQRTWAPGVRVTAGVRSDASTLTARRTVDPRVSVAWQRGSLGLTSAFGIYHQIAEPTFRRETPARAFAPMRVSQWTAGLQWGSDSVGLRVEAYDKRYRDLWQFTATQEPIGGGVGHARGVDLQARWRFSAVSTARVTYSHVQARRTDPTTGVIAPTLADITHSVSTIVDRQIRGLTISSGFRYATGRPFTDILGAVPGVMPTTPVYGAPFGARLPGYLRSDLSVSWYRALGANRGAVLWGSLSNVFGRDNVMRYQWSPDFTRRTPVLAPFNRSLFVGSTLLL